MPIPIKLETPRLVLRNFKDEDTATFITYRNDPEIAKYQSWDIPYPETAAREFIKLLQKTSPGILGEWYQLAIALKTTGEMIGDCAFCILAEDGQQAEIGFTLGLSHQKQGYGTEAVNRLLQHLFIDYNLHRVRANCDHANIASAKLLNRVGMRQEGHFVKSLWSKGHWVDEVWFAILREEWQSQHENS
ncbi:GNAT family N-acetyltransferase [Cylindrospermum sp. FACHB-282]|uniref:GNAT family N-acetyltransferase n=1 Tax=Cylindrospermum sp. FACHB-282 TaxID=2692794 RepID=UPI0016868242|nr:GNAT family protein [Cylindrospermum sp. FACHB-282]MBD2386419.1 GNAT family N-acetyltransferase [Cylindrospermum sp. FACHB-282]